ncbi:MAG TPA: hypothetical protein VJH95_06320, partial [Candidatus Nanoarchaeia archaeon]|nr:hypothetical protein [Candidatus Nanoarchaeia archaeon]
AEGWWSEGHDDGFLDRFYGWVTKEGFDSENLEWKTLSPEDRYAITLLFQQEAKKAREEMGIRD